MAKTRQSDNKIAHIGHAFPSWTRRRAGRFAMCAERRPNPPPPTPTGDTKVMTNRDLLSPDDLEALATGETVLRAVDRSRSRDDVQRYFDGLITEAYKKWVEAGKPSARRERPALRVDSPTEDLARAVYAKLRASAVHLDVGISLDGPHRLAEDLWRVAFSAQDKRKRSPKARS